MSYQDTIAERSKIWRQIGDLQDDVFILEADLHRAAKRALAAYCRQKQKVSTSPQKWQHFSVQDTVFKTNWIRFDLEIRHGSHEFFVKLPSSVMDLEGDDLENEISRVIHEEGEKIAAAREQQAEARKTAEVKRLERLAEELGYTVFPK